MHTRRTNALVAVAGAMLLTACEGNTGSSDGARASASTTRETPSATASAKAAPAKKKVSKAELEAAKTNALRTTYSAMVAKLGAPHAIDGKHHVWATIEDDKCTELRVETSGNKVSGTEMTSDIAKSMTAYYEACAKHVPRE